MRKLDIISGLFLLAVGGGVCLLAYRLGLGSVWEPGAGLIPFGAAALLVLMSLGQFLKALAGQVRARSESETAAFGGLAWGRLAVLVCALVIYGIVLDTLGFHISTLLLMIALLRLSGHKKFFRTVAFSLLTVLCVYLVFEVWLGCPFPEGLLGI